MYTASFLQDQDFIRSLYIVAFACFIKTSRTSDLDILAFNPSPGFISQL